MKRTGIRRGTKRMKRTRLKSRGKRGSMYPHKRQPEFMGWMGSKPNPDNCDGCKRWRWLAVAHIIPRSQGGEDQGNAVRLCDGPGDTCHRKQEKRTDAFISESGRDLHEIAREYEHEYRHSLR